MINQSPTTLEQALEIIQELQAKIAKLEAENQQLKDRLAKNSRNSSKPPSSDDYRKPKPKNLRRSTGRKSGGQKGHPGSTLEMVEHPDHIIEHEITTCEQCGQSLEASPVDDYEARQVVDIDPIQPVVTEHRAQIRQCPHCGHINRAAFPEAVSQPIQYGSWIASWIIYLSQYQLLPYKRLAEMMKDIFGVPLSQGTIDNVLARCFRQLAGFEQHLKDLLIQNKVVHFDETTLYVDRRRHWMHVACTDTLTCYHLDPSRGRVGMDAMGVLPEFRGRAIHDHLQTYYLYECEHGLCNTHHLRELIYAHEQYDQSWADRMIQCLLDAKEEVEHYREMGLQSLPDHRLTYYQRRYSRILRQGVDELPELPKPEDAKPTRGRRKQHKMKNLHDRLRKDKAQVLAFIYDFDVPFDNNQAERDLRMIKAKQKISGCFRSLKGGQRFARIRSYISTVRKHSINVVEALADALRGSPFIPQ